MRPSLLGTAQGSPKPLPELQRVGASSAHNPTSHDSLFYWCFVGPPPGCFPGPLKQISISLKLGLKPEKPSSHGFRGQKSTVKASSLRGLCGESAPSSPGSWGLRPPGRPSACRTVTSTSTLPALGLRVSSRLSLIRTLVTGLGPSRLIRDGLETLSYMCKDPFPREAAFIGPGISMRPALWGAPPSNLPEHRACTQL